MTLTSSAPAQPRAAVAPAISLRDASVRFGDRTLWHDLDLDIAPGEFVAVLGPNGAGKTTLLRVLLGQQPLTSGTAEIAGQPVRRGSRRIGYVPQQKSLDSRAALRGRDLVGFGIDGDRWGLPLPSRARRRAVDEALEAVGASSYANAPLSTLSGGEQQRLRIAQALVTQPRVLLCDEPLLSLDPGHQQAVTHLIDEIRRTRDVAVVFVTHELNAILPMVDRVVHLAAGRALIGTVDEVMTGDVLTELYGSPIEVIRRGDRLIVIGADETPHHDHHLHDDHCAEEFS